MRVVAYAREAWRIVRRNAIGFLVLLGLVLLVARGAPSLWLVLTPLVLCLALLLFWGLGGTGQFRLLRKGSKDAARRRPSLQTIVFRVVLIAMIALFGLVVLAQWWAEREADEAQAAFEVAESAYATGQLNRGWVGQPLRIGDKSGAGPTAGPLNDLGFNGPEPATGIWIDYSAYQRIRAIIERIATNGGIRGQGEYYLGLRGDMWPAKDMLPPSLLPEWRDDRREKYPIMIPGLGAYREIGEGDKPTLAYIKEHGWWIGAGIEDADVEAQGLIPYHYAIFRTGPSTVYFVSSRDHAPDWQPAGAPEQWLQALYIFLFLAPLAGLTAWYLTLQIVDPIERVATASGTLASGEWPDEVPVEGPAELASLAESFNRMAVRLEQAEAAQQSFLANVSHELKTPLTAIEGYAELLADGAVPAETAAAALTGESRRLQRLVADLIELGKMRQDRFEVRREPVSLARVADEVGRRHEVRAREFGVRLEARVTASPTEDAVVGDEDRLVQVASNLVENALRCTPAEGHVTVTAAPGELRVSDTGPGLTEEEQTHAFERFYLYERGGKDRPVGTGLGLTIVKELVDAMGGTVSVSSEPGTGTTFVVRLPAAAGESSPKVDAT